jgi:hypothetical protein
VREVDDVEQAEDDRQAEREQLVERAVDQPDLKLPEQGLGRNAENFGDPGLVSTSKSTGEKKDYFTSAQPPSFSGRNA